MNEQLQQNTQITFKHITLKEKGGYLSVHLLNYSNPVALLHLFLTNILVSPLFNSDETPHHSPSSHASKVARSVSVVERVIPPLLPPLMISLVHESTAAIQAVNYLDSASVSNSLG